STQKAAIRPAIKKNVNVEKVDKATADVLKTQNHYMALILVQPKLRETTVPIVPEMLSETESQELLAFLTKNPTFDPKDAAQLKQATPLANLRDYVKMLVLLYEELYSDLEFLELEYEATRLQVRLIERYVKTKKTSLAEELTDADE